jgi:hypothetical protein
MSTEVPLPPLFYGAFNESGPELRWEQSKKTLKPFSAYASVGNNGYRQCYV